MAWSSCARAVRSLDRFARGDVTCDGVRECRALATSVRCRDRAAGRGGRRGAASAIVAAGAPARGVVVPAAADVLGRVPHDVDPSTFPTITVEQDVLDWNHEITGPGAQEIVLTLAENLQLENQSLLRADASILEAVDHGDRLDEMRDRLDAAAGRPARPWSISTRSTMSTSPCSSRSAGRTV